MSVAEAPAASYEVTFEVALFVAGAILILITAAAFVVLVLRHANRDSDGGGATDDGA